MSGDNRGGGGDDQMGQVVGERRSSKSVMASGNPNSEITRVYLVSLLSLSP